MNKIFLKTLLLSVPILFGSLHANTSDRLEKLEKEMAEITTINSMDNFGVTFSSASPKGSKGI